MSVLPAKRGWKTPLCLPQGLQGRLCCVAEHWAGLSARECINNANRQTKKQSPALPFQQQVEIKPPAFLVAELLQFIIHEGHAAWLLLCCVAAPSAPIPPGYFPPCCAAWVAPIHAAPGSHTDALAARNPPARRGLGPSSGITPGWCLMPGLTSRAQKALGP